MLTYNSLKDAIPPPWRNLLKQTVILHHAITSEEEPHLRLSNNEPKPLSLLKNKTVYWHFVKQNNVTPNCVEKWELIYDTNFAWKNIFRLSSDVTRNTRLQSLQYKILHRIYPCNYWISKWEPNTNELCMSCNTPDTIQHYFYLCSDVYPMWSFFQNWWQTNMKTNVVLSESVIVFGIAPVTKENTALNLCILLGKQYIGNQKYNENRCSLYNLLLKIKHHIAVEKFISYRNGSKSAYDEVFEGLEEALG